MNPIRLFGPLLLSLPLALTLLCACGDDDTAEDGGAGASGRVAASGGSSGSVSVVGGSSGRASSNAGAPAADEGCPAEIPVVGQPCRTRREELCQWKRRGPCPPDPDQLRVCVDGKWIATAPAIRCPDVDAGADAGAD